MTVCEEEAELLEATPITCDSLTPPILTSDPYLPPVTAISDSQVYMDEASDQEEGNKIQCNIKKKAVFIFLLNGIISNLKWNDAYRHIKYLFRNVLHNRKHKNSLMVQVSVCSLPYQGYSR